MGDEFCVSLEVKQVALGWWTYGLLTYEFVRLAKMIKWGFIEALLAGRSTWRSVPSNSTAT